MSALIGNIDPNGELAKQIADLQKTNEEVGAKIEETTNARAFSITDYVASRRNNASIIQREVFTLATTDSVPILIQLEKLQREVETTKQTIQYLERQLAQDPNETAENELTLEQERYNLLVESLQEKFDVYLKTGIHVRLRVPGSEATRVLSKERDKRYRKQLQTQSSPDFKGDVLSEEEVKDNVDDWHNDQLVLSAIAGLEDESGELVHGPLTAPDLHALYEAIPFAERVRLITHITNLLFKADRYMRALETSDFLQKRSAGK